MGIYDQLETKKIEEGLVARYFKKNIQHMARRSATSVRGCTLLRWHIMIHHQPCVLQIA